ncbi:hypothetical protein [Pseudalkalibacillus sp. SCS-8]|uniref:hypothetical protein n=1 Tax=Pseudalkalibacillus nanhaiensis TaxID=3115291 RepID=UPI0032D9C1BF
MRIYTINNDINRLIWVRRRTTRKIDRKGNMIGIIFLLALMFSIIYMYTKHGTLFFFGLKQGDGSYQISSWLDRDVEKSIFILVIVLILIAIFDLLVQAFLKSYSLMALMSCVQIIILFLINNRVFTEPVVMDFSHYSIEDYVYIGLFILFIFIMLQLIITLIIRLINFMLFIHDRMLKEDMQL